MSDLASDLDYPDLEDDAREVLRTLVFSEKQIATRDGRWFTVRIMPYRTTDNVIEGVVITFIDISVAKRLEAELRAAVARGATSPQVTPIFQPESCEPARPGGLTASTPRPARTTPGGAD